MHSSHDIILQAGIDYLSFIMAVDDTDWSDSRRVDSILCRCAHHMVSHCRLAQFKSIIQNHSGGCRSDRRIFLFFMFETNCYFESKP